MYLGCQRVPRVEFYTQGFNLQLWFYTTRMVSTHAYVFNLELGLEPITWDPTYHCSLNL